MDKNKIIYIGILLIVTVLISVTYFSYAFFTSRIEQHGKLNIVAGTLNYQIESNDLVNNSIVLESNESKTINIKITSLNDINSKYELYYTTTNDNIRIGYSNDNDLPVDTIDKNASKDIVITIKNNSDSSTTVTFGVEGGLINNQLVLANGNSINDIINPVVISLNTNGGSIASNKIYLLSGDTIGILPEPIYENKTFDGWYLDDTFNTKVTSSYIVNDNIELYAKYRDSLSTAVRVQTTATGGSTAAVSIYIGTFNENNNSYTWNSSTNYRYNNPSNYNKYTTVTDDTIKFGYIQNDFKWYVYGMTANVKRRDSNGAIISNIGTSSISWGYGTSITYYFTSN